MKYSVYFDEKHLKEDADLITVCNSVESINIATKEIGYDMAKRNLSKDCLYMYKLYEEDHSNLDAYGCPESQELYWEELPPVSL